MKKIIQIGLICTIISSCGQINTYSTSSITLEKDTIAYLIKSVEFIKEVYNSPFLESSFILIEKPIVFNHRGDIIDILRDTTFFTEGEKEMFKSKAFPIISKWPKGLFKSAKIINEDTLKLLFEAHKPNGRKYINENIGKSLYKFSLPIFLRNDNYCLFYYEKLCGSFCSYAYFNLYEKQNGKWVMIECFGGYNS